MNNPSDKEVNEFINKLSNSDFFLLFDPTPEQIGIMFNKIKSLSSEHFEHYKNHFSSAKNLINNPK